MPRERHPEKLFGVTRVARKDHKCAWCPRLIEKSTEYYQGSSRYHLECWEEHQKQKDKAYIATRERNRNPVRRLAYWFVTEFLGKKWSWNLHKRYLAEAKRFVNPAADPITGEAQRSFTVREIMQCLDAMRNGYFGQRVADLYPFKSTIHAVTWPNRSTGHTFLEDWLKIPPLPPMYQRTELQDWIDRYGNRAVELQSITEGELEMLKAAASHA